MIDRSLLAGLPPFAGATSRQLDSLLAQARPTYCAKGANLFEQDGRALSFFALLHGRLRVVKTTPSGQQVVVRFAGPGELVGVATALGLDAYPATAVAAIDSVAIAWPSRAWLDLVAEIPSLAEAALQTVGARLEDAHDRIVELSTEQVEQRIAHVLTRLGKAAGRRVEGGVQIDFPLSRQDIAEATGTTLHNVSRILRAWKAKGWVSGGRKRILINDPHKLFTIAERPAT